MRVIPAIIKQRVMLHAPMTFCVRNKRINSIEVNISPCLFDKIQVLRVYVNHRLP